MLRKVEALEESQRGREFPCEWEEVEDGIAGKGRVVRFTSSLATDQHPYFTGPAVTEGGRLVFISERTGSANLFSMDLRSGRILQLTDNRWGTLRQYVSPWGNRVGFGKYSVSVCAKTGEVFYVQAREVRRVNAATAEEVCIGEIAEGFVTAFTHVSADGRWLCVPAVDERAFFKSEESQLAHGVTASGMVDGFRSVVRAIETWGLESELLVFATDGSTCSMWGSQKSWITHVQFRPGDERYILFNNEGIGDTPGGQRIWMCDTEAGKVWKIRPEPEDRRHWNCHELWTLDGEEVLYHGTAEGPSAGVVGGGKMRAFMGFSDLSGEKYREFFIREGEQNGGYGHFGVHAKKDHAYCDGYFADGLITECSPGRDGCLDFRPLCRHDTKWLSQDDHPHPILSADGSMLVFSSSVRGVGDVYGLRLV
jgi:hypothetical protein